MTVEELIKILNSIPNKNVKVLLASDNEGNAFHSLYGFSLSFSIDEGNDYYELVEDCDEFEDREEVLVLWP